MADRVQHRNSLSAGENFSAASGIPKNPANPSTHAIVDPVQPRNSPSAGENKSAASGNPKNPANPSTHAMVQPRNSPSAGENISAASGNPNNPANPSTHAMVKPRNSLSAGENSSAASGNPNNPANPSMHAMGDRVQPRNSPSAGENISAASRNPKNSANPSTQNPRPALDTLVFQFPKDRTYYIPPNNNAFILEDLIRQRIRRKSRRRRITCLIFLFVVLLAAVAGIMYLIFWPKAPRYSVDRLSIKGFSQASPVVSPVFDITVKAHNPSKQMGVYYKEGSFVNAFHSGINLCNGVVSSFYQPSKNITYLQTVLTGSEIHLSSTFRNTLMDEQREGKIPFKLYLRAPVRFKLCSINITATVKVSCNVMANALTVNSKILSQDCHVSVGLWFFSGH